jgi:hypothetical protein
VTVLVAVVSFTVIEKPPPHKAIRFTHDRKQIGGWIRRAWRPGTVASRRA